MKIGELRSLNGIIDHFAKEFHNEISKHLPTPPSLSQIYHHLADFFTGNDYQTLKQQVFDRPLGFREFVQIPVEMGDCFMNEKGKVIHPFPNTLKSLKNLGPWEQQWLSNNVSTKSHVFIPPALPMSCFGTSNLKLKQFQSWPTDPTHRYYKDYPKLNTGRVGILVFDSNDVIIGFMKWYFWNDRRIVGSDFHFCINNQHGHLDVSFDLRPYAEHPSLGPIIEYENKPLSPKKMESLDAVQTIRDYYFDKQFHKGNWYFDSEIEEIEAGG